MALTEQEIFNKLKDIVAEQLAADPEEVTMEASFIDDLNADSLDLVELIMEIEEKFGIQVPDDAAEKIKTVGDAVSFIQDNQE